jgi:hypothetical protein
MGFQKKHKIYDLDFTGTALEGLTLKARGMTMREALEVGGTFDVLNQIKDVVTPEQMAKIQDALDFFASRIVEWDLEEDGVPVPISGAALMELDITDTMLALAAWQDAVTDVPAPLEQRSSAGSKWEGEPIPMVIPSPSLPN